MSEAAEPKKESGGLRLALDFGPLLVFFLAYKLEGVFLATAAFMVATVIAMVVSLVTVKKIAPMLWLSAILILGFGGITLWLHDPRYIQMKPTFIYALFAAVLFGGLIRKKPMLKYLFGGAFEGLTDKGWLLLSRNWGLFFVAMAVLNEVLRATVSFDTWLTIKVWGVTAASVLFGIANMPMLLKHGLKIDDKEEARSEAVPPQG